MRCLAVSATGLRRDVMAASTEQTNFKVHIKINHVEFATLLSENELGISYKHQTIKNLISDQLRTLDIGIEVEKGLISLLEDVRVRMSVVQGKQLPDRRDLFELSKELRKVAEDVRSLYFSIRETGVGSPLQNVAHHKKAVGLFEHVKKTQTDLRALRKSPRPTNGQGSSMPKERSEMTGAWRRIIQMFCSRRSGLQKCKKTVASESKDKDKPRVLQTTAARPTANKGHPASIPLLGASACRYADHKRHATVMWWRESNFRLGAAVLRRAREASVRHSHSFTRLRPPNARPKKIVKASPEARGDHALCVSG